MLSSMDKYSRYGFALYLCPQSEIDYFVKYDVLGDQSCLLPLTTPASPRSATEVDYDWTPLRKFEWNMVRDETDEVLVDNVADIEAHIEDSWVTTIEGARFPGTMKKNLQNSLDSGMVWKKIRLRGRDELESHIVARERVAGPPLGDSGDLFRTYKISGPSQHRKLYFPLRQCP
jgi:hypothetical protein